MKKALLLTAWIAAAGLAAAADIAPAERLRLADGLYVRGMYDMAAAEYAAWLDGNAADAGAEAALFRLGECRRQLGRLDEADASFERLLREHAAGEYSDRARLRRCEILIDRGQYQAAAEDLESLLAADPPDETAAAALYYLGHARAKNGEGDKAGRRLKELIETHADSPFVSYACVELAALHMKDGSVPAEKTAELYRKALQQPATPRIAAEALFQLAQLEFGRGEYAAAAEAYRRLAAEHPDDLRLPESRLQMASALYHTGSHQEALDMAGAALGQPGGDEAAWLYLKANAERQLGMHEEAARTYSLLQERHADDPLAGAVAYEKALLSFRSGSFDTVIRQVRQVAEDTPTAEVCWLLAESYAALTDRTHAVSSYAQLIAGFPDSALAPRALYRLAEMYRQDGNLAEAAETCRRIAREYPDHELAPRALYEAAACMLDADRTEDAVTDWSQMVMQFPQADLAEGAMYQKALAEVRLGRDAQALKTLVALVRRFPATRYRVEAGYWMGELQDRQGDAADAERALREALAAGPDAEWSARIRYRLVHVLQKRSAFEEAAGMLQPLAEGPFRTNAPPELLEWLALYRLEHKEFVDAQKAAEALTSLAPGAAWEQIGHYLSGRAALGQGKLEQAKAAFKQAAERNADTREGADACLQWGILALGLERIDEARQAFERAAERARGEELMDVRAGSYYGLGRVAEAGALWDEAARYYLSVGLLYDNGDLVPEALFRASAALEKLGRPDEAAKTIEELRQRYPDNPWTAKAGG